MSSYVCVGYSSEDEDREVLYVGMGKGQRWRHLNSGISHCYAANKFHFEGGCVVVEIIKEFDCREDCAVYEKEMIRKLEPRWNIANSTVSEEIRPSYGKSRASLIDADGNRIILKKEGASSKYYGVRYDKNGQGGKYKPRKHWRAYYREKDLWVHIGMYENEEDAAIARDSYIKEKGLPVQLNFP